MEDSKIRELAAGDVRIEVPAGRVERYLNVGGGRGRVEAVVGRDAILEIYDLQDGGADRQLEVTVTQQAGSRVLLGIYALDFGDASYRLDCLHAEPHADLKIAGCAVGDGQRRLRFSSRVEHAAGHCRTDEIFKMVGDGEFRGSFDGLILVKEGAVGTEAYQASRNLLTGEGARIEARPELEIYCDDVKCSHGCAVGQPDPLQMFYMETRGIPSAEARRLLRQAFLTETVDAVKDDELKARILGGFRF